MWPNGKKCAVMLGFDVDAESLWISMNMDSPTPLSRGSYGARVGAPRILDLLDRYSLPATFFVPADTARRHPALVQEIHGRGHEIGHHGDVHESPRELDREAERRVLEIGLETLEKLQDGDRETGIVEIPVAWELDDAPHFLFRFYPKYLAGLSAPSKVLEIWASEFDGAYASEGVFVLTMHPQITGRYHRVVMLEELLQYMVGHPGVWFATGSQVVEEWLKGRG
jgi:peptidoglycan/xylan/chitin deacetylase (PgdA/CDA1 family)